MKLYNLKDHNEQVSFAQAVTQGLGKHQGLFFPHDLPEFSLTEIDDMLAQDFVTRSAKILSAFIGDEIPQDVLQQRVRAAFAFPAPVSKVQEDVGCLELFHGPTLAFKDFGGRFMAQMLTHIAGDKPVTILTATSGDVTLHMPQLKGVSFETAIIERHRRRESSAEEALIEMYLAGASVRRVEDITEVLWGSKVPPATISELNKKAYVHIEDWRNRPLQGGRYPYVYVDGIYLRRNWGGEYENVAVLVAIAVNEDGFREVLGAAEGMKEDKASWVSFFQ